MRTEQELNELIVAARANYLTVVDTMPRAVVETASKVVTELQAELQATLADGADPCPVCEALPIGLLKRPAIFKDGLMDSGPIYEVGCPVCEVRRARGATPEQAVEQWNAGNHNTTRAHQIIG